MPGRTKKRYQYDNPASNLEFLADKGAAKENLEQCRGLLAIAGIDVVREDRAVLLRQIIQSIQSAESHVLAGRDLIGLTDRSMEEINRILQRRTKPGRSRNLAFKMPRQNLAGDRFDIGGDAFHDNYEEASLRALLAAFRDEARVGSLMTSEEAQRRSEPSSIPSRYVPREREEAEFHCLVENDAKVVVFIGQPGIGKSWLARALTAGAPRIRIIAGQVDANDLVGAFEMCGVHEQPDSNPRVNLAKLLCGVHAPRIILLDNLASTAQLNNLLPATGRKSVVVATCRRKERYIPHDWSIIRVHELTPEQGAEMVRIRLPFLSKKDSAKFSSEFGHHPLVLEHACGLYDERRQHTSSVVEFSRSLKADVKHLSQNIETEHGDILRLILQQTVQLLRERDRIAYELYQFVCVVMNSAWTYLPNIEEYARLARLGDIGQVTQAIQAIDDFSLGRIEQIKDDLRLTLHPLVLEIMFEEFRADIAGVLRHALAAYRQLTLETERPWTMLDMKLEPFVTNWLGYYSPKTEAEKELYQQIRERAKHLIRLPVSSALRAESFEIIARGDPDESAEHLRLLYETALREQRTRTRRVEGD